MKSFEGLQKNDVLRWIIESFASSGSNDVWTLQCFMMSVFNALMFPTSVLNINGSNFLYYKEIMRLEEFDWCQAVVDDIRDKVDRWKKNRDKATPLVQGCIAFIMIYYLDNLECEDMIADFVSIPRARFFTSTIIEKIASADRDYLSDGWQKREFLAALDLHDKDVDAAIIKMNEAHKEIVEAQQKIVSEIKSIFGDLVGSSLNTKSPRDARRKAVLSSPNVKRKSQTSREVSPAHTDSGDDGPEIVVEHSPQLSAGQSSFEQQEAAHELADTYVQHEVEQTVTVESVQEEVTLVALPNVVQHEATKSGVDARVQQETLPLAIATPVQHEPTQPAATTVVHDEVELPAADWNEVGNILRELNEDPTQVSLRKEYDIKEAVALTREKERGTQYRAELMYYMFFHKMNEARGPSLKLFELLAPGKTGHNVIEGTQQIIGSSDAMKDGVASCDVEKDDVASRDDQEDVAGTNLK
ncbi:hypothetical protein GUJ93_ZPchr0010g10449 [Zizania palustris]|uniref:Uncharacterized protein n=1 Tax=Zizania palustris TaxID=103762 RepID=A0A8J6BJG7_ZIZPA|nr:hypothetical protein GUJ93_ZPchr0010g10449 [Zizania palustris]